MPERNLRIVKLGSGRTHGRCEACNETFLSDALYLPTAEYELKTLFDVHKCEPEEIIPPEK